MGRLHHQSASLKIYDSRKKASVPDQQLIGFIIYICPRVVAFHLELHLPMIWWRCFCGGATSSFSKPGTLFLPRRLAPGVVIAIEFVMAQNNLWKTALLMLHTRFDLPS